MKGIQHEKESRVLGTRKLSCNSILNSKDRATKLMIEEVLEKPRGSGVGWWGCAHSQGVL